ncbi:MAG: MFS transporter [Coxiella sp. (in: Bacteria)]|nr:MAG: MFS transporter [Coxiella sp. (in: g-proteobacteria)]
MPSIIESQQTERLVSHKESSQHITTLGVCIFVTGILYYCFAYLLRIYPNIMESQFLGHFHTTSLGYSFLTDFYYVAYAPMQIPVGVTVDKMGPRRALLLACFISLLGVFIFSSTNTLSIALAGRFLIGLGAAFAFVTALKLATIWLPQTYFATATGCVTGFGMVAAGFTEIGFTHVLQQHGYNAALRLPLYIGMLLFLLLFLVIKDKPPAQQTSHTEATSPLSFFHLWQYVKLIMRNKQMWLIGLVGALLYLPSSVFLDAWAISYLKVADHFSAAQAANGVWMMLIGWIISSFIAGMLSDLFGSRKIPLMISSFCATLISALLIFSHGLSSTTVVTLLFLFGFACGPHPLCFTLSKENWTKKVSGTAIAFANFIIMMGGLIIQPIIGKTLNNGWHGTFTHTGIRVYTPHDFVTSLAFLPCGLFIGFVLTFFIRETYKKKPNEAKKLNDRINKLVADNPKDPYV